MSLFGFITGVGLWAPGLAGWPQGQAVLAGRAPYEPKETPLPTPPLLPPAERRRVGLAVRLALSVASEALTMAGLSPNAVRAVFGTSNGDGAVLHALLETLTSAEPQLSPTQFHNSVHNAAAGYWTIAAASSMPASCVSLYDWSFSAALLAAMGELAAEGTPVLLCVYDVPLPEPLAQKRQTFGAFAVALALSPRPQPSALASLEVKFVPEPVVSARERPRNEAFHDLAEGNSAARSLRLLEALAREEREAFSLGYLEDARLDIVLSPCSRARQS
ncbi:MAG: beta-ketoacyl synthase chain length factor [Acidobacteriia bacterium]|nr:beta-ketoacyl synthase chain length factor [Methyloceanibacter sp.]MCL6491734.1 beta-ketoacyl synthase chain length factor [Terriglobia bacterium]